MIGGIQYEVQDADLRTQIQEMLKAAIKCENDGTQPIATFHIYNNALKNALRPNKNSLTPTTVVECKIRCYNELVNVVASQFSGQKCSSIKCETEVSQLAFELVTPTLKFRILDEACFESFKKAIWHWNNQAIIRKKSHSEEVYISTSVYLEEVQ